MRAAIFAYSRQGCRTARRVMSGFPAAKLRAYTARRFDESGFQPIPHPTEAFYGGLFRWADALVFVGACGIAVREIAPHVRDKQTDPAVICVDELGQFVIPLLSGHIGGANRLSAQIAEWLHAVPVITTATDRNGKFSVDSWAAENGFVIGDMRRAKLVSAAVLEQEVPLCCDFPVVSAYPDGVVPGRDGALGICISCRTDSPFDETLHLIPKILHVGIGCRKGTGDGAIRDAVTQVLAEHGLDLRAVSRVASIDLKAEEPGLLKFCRDYGLTPVFYSAAELAGVSGRFHASDFVQRVTGVDNVCERAALLGAEELIVGKTAIHGVTVAVAAEKLEVRFG